MSKVNWTFCSLLTPPVAVVKKVGKAAETHFSFGDNAIHTWCRTRGSEQGGCIQLFRARIAQF